MSLNTGYDYHIFFQNDNNVAISWIAQLSTELRRQRANTERLHLNLASERITHYLMTEGNPIGEIEITGTLSELAEILGLSKETLYRTLTKMEKSNKLLRVGNFLQLTDSV